MGFLDDIDFGTDTLGSAPSDAIASITASMQSQSRAVASAASLALSSPTYTNIYAFQVAFNYYTGAGQGISSQKALPQDGIMGPDTQAAIALYTSPNVNGDSDNASAQRPDMLAARVLVSAPIKTPALVLAFQQAYNANSPMHAPIQEDGIYGPATTAALSQYDFSLAPTGSGSVQSAASQLDQAPTKTPPLVALFQNAYNAGGGTPGLVVDGVMGPQTIAALANYVTPEREEQYFTALESGATHVTTEVPPPATTPQDIAAGEASYRRATFGDDAAGMDVAAAKLLLAAATKSPELVRAFQLAYNANGGTPALTVDGILGPMTAAALAKFRSTVLGSNTGLATATTTPPQIMPSTPATAPMNVTPKPPIDWSSYIAPAFVITFLLGGLAAIAGTRKL